MEDKKDSIRLSTYDELFRGPTLSLSTIKKLKSIKLRPPRADPSSSSPPQKTSELFLALQKQRVVVDERAIHFVAEARAGVRADARNSVFKLSQKYQMLPDREHVQQIKKLYGKVKENEDSGDEEWDKASSQLPFINKSKRVAFLDLIKKETGRDQLINQMEEIEQETAELPPDVVTQEVLPDEEELNELKMILEETGNKFNEADAAAAAAAGGGGGSAGGGSAAPAAAAAAAADKKQQQSDSDEDEDSDVEFGEEELKTLNTMQREFIGNNLVAWFKDIQKAYETGVKLVKVNRMGYKFIRILSIKDMVLSIYQPHTQSQAKVDRQVSLPTICSVSLGKNSKEFEALEELVKAKKEDQEFNPHGTVCCVVSLPKNRSLSLVFLDEDNRNGFVFFLRVLINKAKAAMQQLEKQEQK